MQYLLLWGFMDINFLKKKKNDMPIDKIYEISDDNSELNKVIDNIEFNKLISKLNDKEKEIISLRILSNFSFEEIAKLLKEPVGTVKWRYYKSIYSLKAILGNLAMFIVSFTIGIKTLLSNMLFSSLSLNLFQTFPDICLLCGYLFFFHHLL